MHTMTDEPLPYSETPPTIERRNQPRHPVALPAVFQPVPGRLHQGGWRASILNISCDGLRLLSRRPFEPETLLAIEAHTAAGTVWGTLHAQVLYSLPQDQGQWMLGCLLVDPLDEEDVDALRAG